MRKCMKMITSVAVALSMALSPVLVKAEQGITIPPVEIETSSFEEIDASSTISTVKVELQYGQTEARKMLDRINYFRAHGDDEEGVPWAYTYDGSKKYYTGLKPLAYDYELEEIAMQRAAELALYFSHTRPNGYSCFSLSGMAVYVSFNGENIAGGYNTEESVFVGWAEHDYSYAGQGHRRNMLGSYNAIGIGHVYYNGVDYWVQDFGYTEGKAKSPTTAIDGKKIATVEIEDGDFVINTDVRSVTGVAGQSQQLPKLEVSVTLEETWPGYPCPLVPEWFVENENIATISGGTIHFKQPGKTNLLAGSKDGINKKIPLTVTCTHSFKADGSCQYCGIISLDNKYGKTTLKASSKSYTGSAIKPDITVINNGKTLKVNTDYKLQVTEQVRPGTYTFTVTGIGNYMGTVTGTWTISAAQAPAPITGLKAVSAGKKAVKLTWNESKDAEGYIIYRKIGSAGAFTYCYMVNSAEYLDKTADDEEYCFYKVYPYVTLNGKRTIGASTSYVYAKGLTTKVTVKAYSQKGGVKLVWTQAEGADGYLIYAIRNGAYGQVGYVPRGDKLTYFDSKAPTTYYSYYFVFPYHKSSSGSVIPGACSVYTYGIALK